MFMRCAREQEASAAASTAEHHEPLQLPSSSPPPYPSSSPSPSSPSLLLPSSGRYSIARSHREPGAAAETYFTNRMSPSSRSSRERQLAAAGTLSTPASASSC